MFVNFVSERAGLTVVKISWQKFQAKWVTYAPAWRLCKETRLGLLDKF